MLGEGVGIPTDEEGGWKVREGAKLPRALKISVPSDEAAEVNLA